jgi:hypothetical protein
MQKVGMKFEGYIEHAPFSNGPVPKQKLYAILQKDFDLAAAGSQNCAADVTPQSGGRT